MSTLTVKYAVYGALPGGHGNEAQAYVVTSQLQGLINSHNGIVACNNASFGDPSPGNTKHFGALVLRNNQPFYFACQENQTIDFKSGGGSPNFPPLQVVSAVYGALPNGNGGAAEAFDVTAMLQGLIQKNEGVVACANISFGDPSPGNTKHFAAVVARKGVEYFFACQENQTINFNEGGGT